jgi:hypothetical protein
MGKRVRLLRGRKLPEPTIEPPPKLETVVWRLENGATIAFTGSPGNVEKYRSSPYVLRSWDDPQ